MVEGRPDLFHRLQKIAVHRKTLLVFLVLFVFFLVSYRAKEIHGHREILKVHEKNG